MSKYEITINGSKFVVEVGDVSTSPVELFVNGERKMVEFRQAPMIDSSLAPETPPPSCPGSRSRSRSPL